MQSKGGYRRRSSANSQPTIGAGLKTLQMLAEQSVLEAMRIRAEAGKPLTVGTIPKAAAEHLMRRTRGALSEAQARHEVAFAIRRLSANGHIEAPIEAGVAWQVVRK
jgi:hypothetical protein